MKKYLLPIIIALSALSVSISAAFYSVTGLSMLFAGASLAVLIMASSLEVAKLVIASLLYQYWDKLNKVLRTYLAIAACVLVLITSAGIYGFLSSAYQTTATKSEIVDKQIAALETKKQLYIDSRDNILKEKQSLSELRGTLSKGSTTQFTDRKGNLVVRTNNAAIRNIESASKSDEKLSEKVDIVNDSIFSLENQILEVKTNSEATSELGPLKYISNLTGQPMDKIINWFLLVIIFVFDPLAISLVIAANFAFAQIRKDPVHELTDESKEWLDAPLVEETLEWDEYGNPIPLFDDHEYDEPNEKLKQAAEEYDRLIEMSPILPNDVIRWFTNMIETGEFEEDLGEMATCCYECCCFPCGCSYCKCFDILLCNCRGKKPEPSEEDKLVKAAWKLIELPEVIGRIKPTEIAQEPQPETPPPLIIVETKKSEEKTNEKKVEENAYDIYNLSGNEDLV
jgi:hypothetical protein